MDVEHVAIWVSDFEESREFLVDTLGLTENRSKEMDSVRNAWIGGERGEIQIKSTGDHDVPEEDRARMDHVAVKVGDVDSVCEAVGNHATYRVVRDPKVVERLKSKLAFVEGPDGYVFEIVERL